MAFTESNIQYDIATYIIDILAIAMLAIYLGITVFIGMKGFVDFSIFLALFLVFVVLIALTNEFGYFE